LVLDIVKQTNVRQRLGAGRRIGTAGVVELAARVRQAGNLGDMASGPAGVDAVVSAKGVGLQIHPIVTAPSGQELHRPVAAAAGGVGEHILRMFLVPQVDPEPSGLRGAGKPPIQNVHRRVVGVDHPGLQHFCDHQIVKRLENIGTLGHPVAHRRAGDVDVVALQDPFQPMQRKMIAIFADDHVRQQPRCGEPFLNR